MKICENGERILQSDVVENDVVVSGDDVRDLEEVLGVAVDENRIERNWGRNDGEKGRRGRVAGDGVMDTAEERVGERETDAIEIIIARRIFRRGMGVGSTKMATH
jgi:hypothetical protein